MRFFNPVAGQKNQWVLPSKIKFVSFTKHKNMWMRVNLTRTHNNKQHLKTEVMMLDLISVFPQRKFKEDLGRILNKDFLFPRKFENRKPTLKTPEQDRNPL
jgi:hypothetical protein